MTQLSGLRSPILVLPQPSHLCHLNAKARMTHWLPHLIVIAMFLVTSYYATRRFFMTNKSAGYVFIAINWLLLALAAILFAVLVRMLGG